MKEITSLWDAYTHTHKYETHRLIPKQVFIGQFTESAVVTIPKKNRPKSPEEKNKLKKKRLLHIIQDFSC